MDDYEDSFETATTATHHEEEMKSLSASAMTSTSSNSVNAGGESAAQADGDGAQGGAGGSDTLILSPAAALLPTSEDPVLPLPAAPGLVSVPVPVPVPRLVSSPVSSVKGGSNNEVRAPSTLSAHNVPVWERPLGLGQHPTAGGIEGKGGSASVVDSAGGQYATTCDSSNADRNEFGVTATDEADFERRGLKGADFESLSRFVAFRGGGSDGTVGAASRWQSSVIGTGTTASSSVPGRPLIANRDPDGQSPRVSEDRLPRGESVASKSKSALQAETPPKALLESRVVSAAASSVFSTLSQHLQQPHQPQPQHTLVPAPGVSSTTGAPLAPALATSLPATSLTSPEEPSMKPLVARQLLDFPQPDALATEKSPPPATASFSLPALPPPGWASTTVTNDAVTAPTEAPWPVLPTTAAAKDATATQNRWMIGDVEYRTSPTDRGAVQQVPPLPPPYDHHRPTEEHTRTSDLREASEAVERLVKAFAVLKGCSRLEKAQHRSHPVAGNVPSPVEASAAVVASTHRAGSASTVRVHSNVRPPGPRIPLAGVASVATAAPPTKSVPQPEDRESLAEGMVLDCVLGLLREHASNTTTSSAGAHQGGGTNKKQRAAASSWQTARPHYEVVTADDFAYGTGARGDGRASSFAAGTTSTAMPPRTYFDPSPGFSGGLGSSGVPLFDPRDRQSAVDLYNAVREALEKYVLRRVLTGTENRVNLQSCAPPPRAPPITAFFAWALLIDMMSLCEEIARVAYDASPYAPSAMYPVLVQFRGDAACEEVAKAAMHCLPFEALSTHSGGASAGADGGCVFRMACWVTQQQLWTMTDALADTVREDVVRRSKVLHYSLFNTATVTEVDPRVLAPPATPMLTLRPLTGRRGGGALTMAAEASEPSASAAPRARVHRGGKGEVGGLEHGTSDKELFELPAAALQKIAYHVSVLTTDLLTDMNAADHRAMPAVTVDEYPDVATAVAETLSELLQDEPIKAAVRRRASEKVKKAQAARANFATATCQRREQAIIDRAEREAGEVVQHILQEMRAQGVA
ncbi:hypothetical protein LSCM1_04307 [Leishmania martiniquensis]|uniref:Uncharacterized protein n=1 Tax=Leishmania martiniquensis TaxID=1580590 RepID=A0A836HB66_9TRYP|nr:hypothetical protein LSCM1_04307 [Leishmania martiniquensis]